MHTTSWTWNVPIEVGAYHSLTVVGEGFDNGATKITVDVLMTQNRTQVVNGATLRIEGCWRSSRTCRRRILEHLQLIR